MKIVNTVNFAKKRCMICLRRASSCPLLKLFAKSWKIMHRPPNSTFPLWCPNSFELNPLIFYLLFPNATMPLPISQSTVKSREFLPNLWNWPIFSEDSLVFAFLSSLFLVSWLWTTSNVLSSKVSEYFFSCEESGAQDKNRQCHWQWTDYIAKSWFSTIILERAFKKHWKTGGYFPQKCCNAIFKCFALKIQFSG